MLFKFELRQNISRFWIYMSPFFSCIFTLLCGAVLFKIMGEPVLNSLYLFFIEPITSFYGLSELSIKATPIILCAIGLSFAFRANIWNIGAEGQLIMGAITGGGIALLFYQQQGVYIIVLILLFGIFGGSLWGALPALFKIKWNTNEILTSLMLTYIATLILSYLVHGPWRDPDGFNFPESRLFNDYATLSPLFEEGRFNIGFIITLFSVFLAWFILKKHLIGFQIKVTGMAPLASNYAGFNQKKIVFFTLILSGALSGLAGAIEVSGTVGQLVPNISPGYGFTAIIVAFIGRLNPIGILFAGLLLALTFLGGENIQINSGVPKSVTILFQALVLFFLLACDVLIHYKIIFVS